MRSEGCDHVNGHVGADSIALFRECPLGPCARLLGDGIPAEGSGHTFVVNVDVEAEIALRRESEVDVVSFVIERVAWTGVQVTAVRRHGGLGGCLWRAAQDQI